MIFRILYSFFRNMLFLFAYMGQLSFKRENGNLKCRTVKVRNPLNVLPTVYLSIINLINGKLKFLN